jgi:hypothetical protein
MSAGLGNISNRHRRWTKAEDRLLGAIADKIVARRTGHPIGSVGGHRRQLGLTDPSRRPYWSAREDRLLGTCPDIEAAKKLNRSLSGIKNRRKKLKISAWVSR